MHSRCLATLHAAITTSRIRVAPELASSGTNGGLCTYRADGVLHRPQADKKSSRRAAVAGVKGLHASCLTMLLLGGDIPKWIHGQVAIENFSTGTVVTATNMKLSSPHSHVQNVFIMYLH